MAIELINNGQEDWLSTLNGDLSQIGDKVSSVKVSGTFINGCSGGSIDCTMYTIGARTLNVTQGSFQTGLDLSSSARVLDFAQLATDIDAGVGIAYSTSGDWAVTACVTSNQGKLTLTVSNGDAGTITKGTWFSFLMIRAY